MKNRLILLILYPLCILVSLFAAIRTLYAIFTNPQRAWVMLIAHDQLANAAANGDPDETGSSRAARARREGRRWGCILCRILDTIEKDHCKKSTGI